MERAARKRAAFLLLEAQFPREGAPSFRANLQRPRRKCLANSRLAAELAESLVRWGFRNSDSTLPMQAVRFRFGVRSPLGLPDTDDLTLLIRPSFLDHRFGTRAESRVSTKVPHDPCKAMGIVIISCRYVFRDVG
jgi:hypothetical protein